MEAIQFESRLIYKTKHNQVLKNIMTVMLGSFLLAVSAQITLPIQPVPITLQSFAALFMGMAFGPKMGSKIVLAYLCEGVLGLPVFANFSWGLHVLLGPTGGYLLGFIPAAILSGYLLQTGWARYRATIFFATLFGTMALFLPGYLMLVKFVGFHNAYLLGIAPFYMVEACKLFVFTIITPLFWRRKAIKNGNIKT